MANDLQAVTGGRGNSGISWLFCALVFIAPFVIPRQFYDFSVVSKEAIYQIGTMAILTLWMLTGRRTKLPAVIPYILIFLAYVWSTLLWAVNPYEGFTTALHWSICALAVVIVSSTVNKNHLFLIIFASGVVVAIIGLLQHYAGFDYFQQVIKPSSTFANKNFAAHYVVVCLPLGLIVTGKRRALTALGAALILAYVWACKTDAAILAILAMVGFVCIRKPKFLTGLIPAVIILAFAWHPGGLKPRLEFWKDTARMAIDHPAGVGLGNFKVIYPAYGEAMVTNALEYTHSEYAQLWAETGFIGVILLVLAFAGTIMTVDFKNIYGVAALVGICVVSAFSFPLRLPCIPFVGACCLGAVSK